MKLVFATNNLNKLAELQDLLPKNIEILSLKDIGCNNELSENRETLISELENLSKNLPKNYGAKGNFSLISGTGPVINNLSFSQYVSKLTSNLFGEESAITVKPVSVADDMSEFMQVAPSVYALLGGRKDGAEMHHNSNPKTCPSRRSYKQNMTNAEHRLKSQAIQALQWLGI